MKKILKLISTTNGNYIFDTQKDELVQISDGAFEYLAILADEHQNEGFAKVFEEICKLQESGHLTSGSSIEKAPYPITNLLGTFRPQWDFSSQ